MQQTLPFPRQNTRGTSTHAHPVFLRSALLWMALLAATATYAQQPFITTWKTDNPGFSNSTSIVIPTTGPGYNYEVDWNNDGIYDQSGLTSNVLHDFGVAGIYTIRIRGAFPRIYCNDAGDRRKLLDVGQWGDQAWTSMSAAFYGCSNLQVSATDLPNLSGVTDLSAMFANCSILNGPANIGSWNTANVTDMRYVFLDALAFNQPIGNWNTANVTSMDRMFDGATVFNQPIGNWNTANVTDMGFMFRNAQAFNQPIGAWNTANVTDTHLMFSGATAFNQSLGNWTLNASVNLNNMLDNNGMDCENYSVTLIGWSDNPATPNGRSLGAVGQQYGTNAVVARTNLDVTKGWTITGDAPSGTDCILVLPFITTWKTDNPGSSNNTSITIPTTGGGYNYEVDWNNDGSYDESGITGNVTHDFGVAGTYTIRLRGAFPRIYFSDTGDRRKLLDVGQWGDVAWTSMNRAFTGCSNLQVSAADLPNLSGVTDLTSMFESCSILNGPANIGNWNTTNVTDMKVMFANATAFNQPIGTWNTANVSLMIGMFSGAQAFNQPIGAWNTANVTDMDRMFFDASAFNQPIGNWNTANVTNMFSMFSRATVFNRFIGNWNTANVTNMGSMFSQANAFDQSIGNWNTANVTNMSSMFSLATAFNRPIGTWNTVNVTNMANMFLAAPAFNQPIGDWNTANVTSMVNMFSPASAFNQPIGDWTLNASVNLGNMLNNSGLDCDNYSATLIGWSDNPATPNGRSLGATGREYNTTAAAARDNLIVNKGWTISGDAACAPLPATLLGFTGRQQENGILLEWQTASEQNNAGFHIERSPDGLRWTDIGFVAGKGLTTEVQDYSFLDKKPLPGTSYYRLQQIDFHGKAEVSNVVQVTLQNAGTVRVFPNPVSNGELHLLLPENTEAAIRVQLFSPLGQLVRSMMIGSGPNVLDVKALPTGTYTLQIVRGPESSFEKIVVQH